MKRLLPLRMALCALAAEALSVVLVALSVLALFIFSAPPPLAAVDMYAPLLGPYVTFFAGLLLCFLATRRVVKRSAYSARHGWQFVGLVCVLDVLFMLGTSVPLGLFPVLSLLGRAFGGYLGVRSAIGHRAPTMVPA
jgi:hypothetical protein